MPVSQGKIERWSEAGYRAGLKVKSQQLKTKKNLTVADLGEGGFDINNHMIIIGKLDRNIITTMITVWRY